MKKVAATFIILIVAPLLFLKVASAQLLVNTTAPGGLDEITTQVATQANFGHVDIGVIVAQVIRTVLGFLAIIFVILIIFSGFRWMTAAGNEDAVNKAKSMIKNAIIGLIIVLVAYAITYFVLTKLGGSGGGTGSSTL